MKKLRTIFTVLFLILIFSIVYFFTYNLAEPKAYDFMTKTCLTERLPLDKTKQVYGSDDVVLAVIDAKTTAKYQWPWAREDFCEIFDYFSEYGKPKVVVFDFLLINSDVKKPASEKKLYETLNHLKNVVVGFLPAIEEWEDKNYGEKYDKILKYPLKKKVK